VDENIEILEARILSGQQAIEENSGAIASWNGTILESNWEIARLSWEIERLTQEISNLNTLIAWYTNDEINKINSFW
jgi:chromosome segregation ATPase